MNRRVRSSEGLRGDVSRETPEQMNNVQSVREMLGVQPVLRDLQRD